MTKNQQILAKMGGGTLTLLLSLSLGQQASAATLVDNLTQTKSFDPSVTSNQWVRSSFRTGSNVAGYTLESVGLLFWQSTESSNLSVRLHSDHAGSLGSQITSFTNPSSITPNQNTVTTFTLANPQTLTPDTTYWLVAGISSGTGEYRWTSTTSINQTGFSGWSIGDTSFYSSDQGSVWSSFTTFASFQFSVNGTENTPPPPPTNIPEPGSVVALLGLGGLGLASRLKKLSTRA